MERKPHSSPYVRLAPSPKPAWTLSEREIAAFKAQSDRTTQQMRANLRG